MRTKRSKSIVALLYLSLLVIFLNCSPAYAEPPLLTLEVESVILKWQDEFVLQLTIYGPADMALPPVTVDGLDQFKLQGTGKNLLQIPRGKTQKWVLTYTLIAAETGNFKIGPAALIHEGRSYRSNIVFLTIEGPAPRKRSKPEPEQTSPDKKREPAVDPAKKEKRAPAEPPKEEKQTPVDVPAQKETVKPAVVMSAAQIGDRILILMETRKSRPYQLQGVPVSVRLLSQLPVENLEFLEEADFPGFLRYDFPFTSKPKGEVVNYRNKVYASYDLVKFLLFPLEGGKIQIPPVRCELKVRVPSGAFPEADLRLKLERFSNRLDLHVTPSPAGAVVGDFVLKNEIVVDDPESKLLRLILEGKGPLSTFNFPDLAGPGFTAKKLSVSTSVKMDGENLLSRKIQDLEITPEKSTTSIVLPEVRIREFDPDSGTLAALRLPSVTFNFQLPGAAPVMKVVFPRIQGGSLWVVFLILGFFAGFTYLRNFRPPAPRTRIRLRKLFSNKNMKLQISKSAARTLYQEIAIQIAQQEGNKSSITEALLKHLPPEEWLSVQKGLRKLERMAYSATKSAPLTYLEMKTLCEKIEALWVH